MPGSDSQSSAPGHMQVKKKYVITAIGGVIATIITAATPGFLSWMESAGERAKHSQEVAEHAKIKGDMAYQQIWNYMQSLETRIAGNKEDLRNLIQRVDMLIMLQATDRVPDPPKNTLHLRGSGRRSGGVSGPDSLDDLLGLARGFDGGSLSSSEEIDEECDPLGGYADEAMEESPPQAVEPAPIQQQMLMPPEQLEAMVKDKIESDKKVYKE